jgi:nucleotide-binding universal stress UspA family protein
MVYDKIVVGTDGSAGSAAAAGWTARVAGVCGAEVTIVHGLAPLLEHMFSIPPLASDELVALVSRELSGAWSEPFREAAVQFECLLVEDAAAAAVLSAARKRDVSLIVLGRHGHTRWSPHVMGGVVHKVLSDAICPVVIVPTSWEGTSPDGPTDIVVGVDGSECSLAALDWAIRHAEMFGLGVRVVTAVFTQAGGEVVWLAPADEEKAGKAAEEELGRILEKQRLETDVGLTMKVTRGHPGSALVEESADAVLVVAGSRGLGSVAELLTGSTSHYVAARTRCPTVIVR